MKMSKAIEISRSYIVTRNAGLDPDVKEAIKLLIEAGEAYQKSQAAGWYPPGYKLQGETPEEGD